MTNFSRWQSYTENLSSPQNFVDWSWRFTIAAALQRRVAIGGDPKEGHRLLFPNLYTILVGKAGVGKGVVITPATELLRFHKRKDFMPTNDKQSEQEKLVIQKVEQANLEDAEATMLKLKRGGEKIDPPLFPYAPDATTYEKLVEDMSKSGRRINFTHEVDGEKKLGIYYHCSMYFSLPELGSLFRKRTEDTVNFMLGLYDCPLDYEYKTKTKDSDRVRRGCLSILAGTTPEFMETVFNQQLIDQGFSSRSFFIYAAKNRKNVGLLEDYTPLQMEYRKDLLAHIKQLAMLYGEVKFDNGVRDWFNKWWDEYENNRHTRSNVSPKLDPYYARKNIHVLKVAMANHFSESLDLVLPQFRIEEAIEDLAKEEKNMHMALTFEGDNPLGKVSDKVVDYLRLKGKATMVDLQVEFWKQLPNGKKSMEECLGYLIEIGKIEVGEEEDKITSKPILYYKTI